MRKIQTAGRLSAFPRAFGALTALILSCAAMPAAAEQESAIAIGPADTIAVMSQRLSTLLCKKDAGTSPDVVARLQDTLAQGDAALSALQSTQTPPETVESVTEIWTAMRARTMKVKLFGVTPVMVAFMEEKTRVMLEEIEAIEGFSPAAEAALLAERMAGSACSMDPEFGDEAEAAVLDSKIDAFDAVLADLQAVAATDPDELTTLVGQWEALKPSLVALASGEALGAPAQARLSKSLSDLGDRLTAMAFDTRVAS